MNLSQVSILTFLSCTLLVLGIYQLITKDSSDISRRMQKITAKTFKEKLTQAGAKEYKFNSWRELLQRYSQIFSKLSISKRMEIQLTKADLPLRGEEFVVLILLAGMGSMAFFLMFTMNLSFGLVAGTCGIILPFIFVRITRQKRLAKFNFQIGDALGIMSNSLRSGFSFLQAMDMVRKELPDPISKEFGRTFQEMNLGTPAEEALQNMAERVKSDDLDLLVTAVLIQRQIGGNLAEVLDNIADTIRERVRIKGQIKSVTAQGRISGLVIGLMPFALAAIMFIISPSYILTLFTSKIGIMLVVGAIFMEFIGVMAIKKIIDIEV